MGAECPLLAKQIIVLDGNHRVYRAYRMDSPITAIVLREDQMYDALIHDRFRLYYAIHWNLSRWLTIEMSGKIPSPYPRLALTRDRVALRWRRQ